MTTDYKPLTPIELLEIYNDAHADKMEALVAIERAAIENYLAQKGQPFPLLAADHKGMRVDYSGMLHQAANALVLGHKETGLAEMLRQLQEHLTELGLRWYGGDTAVVDELLQLYCVCKDSREFIRNRDGAAPTPPAPQDARAGKAGVPHEWKLVPTNPTENMINAAAKAESRHVIEDRKRGGNDPQLGFKGIYQAMIAVAPTPPTSASAVMEMCERCQGNGEIVTDWERYKRPHPGDVGDEAVAECPDCDGTGNVSALLVAPTPPAPQDAQVGKDAERWRSMTKTYWHEPLFNRATGEEVKDEVNWIIHWRGPKAALLPDAIDAAIAAEKGKE